MKKRKIMLSILMAGVVLGLTACGSSNKKSTNNDVTQSDVSSSLTPTTPTTSVVTPTTPNESGGKPTTPGGTLVTPTTPTTSVVTPTTPGTNQGDNNQTTYPNNGANEGNINFNDGKVTTQGQIKVNESVGLQETAYLLFDKVANADYAIYYAYGNESFKKADNKIAYVREYSQTQMRVDLMGLKAGDYKIEVVPVVNNIENTSNATTVSLTIEAYDRSGYAHFNYTEGVGAYNDDGTLKDNAIVIYVTNENKDTVMTDICNAYSDINMFKVPGSSWGNKDATGIGWWLNNTQYTKKDKNGNPGNTYSATGQTLGMYSVCENHPVVIRFVGSVLTPEGCTAYDSTNEGGTTGDNGHMARMKDLRNVTLEGVGNDAIIDGWGFHFMSTSTDGSRGKNFEARNLTFVNYAEDALGMEGVQASDNTSSKISGPVSHCWVHHCTFFPGYCASPAESDKAEGDGSCDFKRGFGFTMSYCYFEYCHKTNLIGSGDTSLQYDISFHHNIWYNCGSRIPLMRNANIHFYNNLAVVDTNTINKTPESTIHHYSCSKVAASYVTSLRASSYMYSENNYFDGAKQVFETGEGGGNAKCFGNIYASCFQDPVGATEVTSREEKVANKCKYTYGNVDYSSFDTNPNLFYYDSVNKKSDCYLTTATVAREECLKFTGSQYRTLLDGTTLSTLNTASNLYTPTAAVDLSSGSLDAELTTSKGDSTKQNILYSGVTGVSSGTIKFKGQGITFKLVDYAEVSVTMSGTQTYYGMGYLMGADGTVYLNNTGKAVLKPGVYYICSAQKDKETSVSELKFSKYDSEEANKALINDYNSKKALIPQTITYTKECYQLIKAAMDAYNNLNAELKAKVDYISVQSAYNNYLSLGKSKVEGLIAAIGTVDANSGSSISSARSEYDYLMSIDNTIVISNYQTLTQAETAFEQFAVQSCIDKINAIGTVTLTSQDAIVAARNEYNALPDGKKSSVTNYQTLVAAEAKFEDLRAVNEVDLLIENCQATIDSYEECIQAYDNLTQTQKAMIANPTKYSTIKVSYTKALINAIGTVTGQSQPAINKARSAYDLLTEVEKQAVDNYETLTQAEATISTMVQEYTMTYDSATESLSAKTGTTKDGFTYKCNKFDGSAMTIKKSDSNYITTKELNSCEVTITVTAKMLDTSNSDNLEILVTYMDGSTETKLVPISENKVYSTQSITLTGKAIKTISIVGASTNSSKNVCIQKLVVVYKK